MAGLVDGEIQTVQPSVGPWGAKTLPAVDGQYERQRKPPASFPSRVVARACQISSAVCMTKC
jgi:hypothetical protein